MIVIVSLAAPTCNCRFKPTVLSASTTTPTCSYWRKPVAETEMVYVPGGSGVMTYNPAPVVWRSVFTPVAILVAVTVTPGITPPAASVTTP